MTRATKATSKKQQPEQHASAEVEALDTGTASEGAGAEPAKQDAAGALANLEALASEASADDDTLAEEVSSTEQRAIEARQDQQARQQAAQFSAMIAVGFLEKMVQMPYPFVVIENEAKAGAVEALAPLLAKHNAGMPEWLLPYQEEFRAAVTLGGIGVGVWMQVRAYKAAEEAAAANDAAPSAGRHPAPPQQPAPQPWRDSLDPNAEAG